MAHEKAPAFEDLRNKVFAIDPVKFGIPTTGGNEIFGVIMDIGFSEGWVSLIVLADGNASIYLSSGGGIIGGLAHDAVREAAIAMTQMADDYADAMELTEDTPLPPAGDVSFYVLTTKGIRAAMAKEDDVGEQRHILFPLYFAGQEVITLLRQNTEEGESEHE